jgi:hypothetical protein
MTTKIISQGNYWELFEKDGVSYYVFAKFIDDSWAGFIECRSCPKGNFSDESYPWDSPELAIINAKQKLNIHHSSEHE